MNVKLVIAELVVLDWVIDVTKLAPMYVVLYPVPVSIIFPELSVVVIVNEFTIYVETGLVNTLEIETAILVFATIYDVKIEEKVK